jgi:hypothetical protein
MSHIQGQPHPEGATEHLEYVRIDTDNQGSLSIVTVVTRHIVSGIRQPQEVTVYRLNPAPFQRDLAAVLSAARRTALQGILTAMTVAVTAADTLTDPAPPLPRPLDPIVT